MKLSIKDFSSKRDQISKSTFLIEHLRATASVSLPTIKRIRVAFFKFWILSTILND